MEPRRSVRATKKALEAYCEENQITPEDLWVELNSLYPGKYRYSQELVQLLLWSIFKTYAEIGSGDVERFLRAWDAEPRNYKYSVAFVESIRLDKELDKILEGVKGLVSIRDVRASEFTEWNEEVKQFIKDKTAHWTSTIASDGKFSYGLAFRSMFSYYHYDHEYPPFHCYATRDGDILFTKTRHEWDGKCYDFEVGYNPAKAKSSKKLNPVQTMDYGDDGNYVVPVLGCLGILIAIAVIIVIL